MLHIVLFMLCISNYSSSQKHRCIKIAYHGLRKNGGEPIELNFTHNTWVFTTEKGYLSVHAIFGHSQHKS